MEKAKSLKNILIARFNRKGGGSKNTAPFENFSETIQENILTRISLEENEIPIVLSLTDKKEQVIDDFTCNK